MKSKNIGWILHNSVEDVNYRLTIPKLTDEELTYCLDHETRKSGLEQLLREARRRVRTREGRKAKR